MRALFILMAMLSLHINAQTAVKTQTFTVKGNCHDCKERIENAADIKGVKVLQWNVDSKIATATYDTTKITLSAIQEAIAKMGYDAGDKHGNDKAYKKLPSCCRYREGECKEK